MLTGVGESYFGDKGYRVFFSGEKLKLTSAYTDNLEWIVGPPPKIVPGKITSISPDSHANPPGFTDWVKKDTEYDIGVGAEFDYEYVYVEKFYSGKGSLKGVSKYWNGKSVRDSDTEKYEKGKLMQNQRDQKLYKIEKYKRERHNVSPDS